MSSKIQDVLLKLLDRELSLTDAEGKLIALQTAAVHSFEMTREMSQAEENAYEDGHQNGYDEGYYDGFNDGEDSLG